MPYSKSYLVKSEKDINRVTHNSHCIVAQQIYNELSKYVNIEHRNAQLCIKLPCTEKPSKRGFIIMQIEVRYK